MIYILLQVVRIIVNIIYFVQPNATYKITFYLELIITIVASFMPVEVALEREAMYQLAAAYITFMMSYLHWKCDISLSVLSLLAFFINRALMHDEKHRHLIVIAVVTLLWHALTLFVTHLAVVKIGTIVAENSVLRDGNNSLLDNFKERITIFEESSKKIVYTNVANFKNVTESRLL